jgi:hypothetical protein
MTPRRSVRSGAAISAVLALLVLILPDNVGAETDWLRFPKRDSKETVRESVFNYVIISRDGPVVRFRRMENGATVSAIDLSRPTRQVVP